MDEKYRSDSGDAVEPKLDAHEAVIRGYLRDEFVARSAAFTEENRKKYAELRERVAAHLSRGVRVELPDVSPQTAENYRLGREINESGRLVQRPYFLVRVYPHPVLGHIARSYVGAWVRAAPGRNGYSCCLFTATSNSSTTIVSRYDLDVLDQEGPHMRDASGLVWIHHSGMLVGNLHSPLATRRFASPDEPLHRVDFDQP